MATRGPKIVCEGCGQRVGLYSLIENDGIVIGCGCRDVRHSVDAMPYEMGVRDLNDDWVVAEDSDDEPDRDDGQKPLVTDGGSRSKETGTSQRSIDNREGCHCCGEDCPGDYCLKCKLADCKPFGRCKSGLITDGGTDRHVESAPHTRILLYLVALSAILAVAFHILGHSRRAWWMSVMVGYGLVLVVIFRVGDFIVYRYLVGDSNE